jgi:hypothetical protein
MFKLTRIDQPSWAKPSRIQLECLEKSDFDILQQYREIMLDVVHQEVESYLNTPELYCEGDTEGFPNISRMTGEYYIGDESYWTQMDTQEFRMSIFCCFLSHPTFEHQIDLDYLGLEIWMTFDPSNASFEIYRNTDSSVI